MSARRLLLIGDVHAEDAHLTRVLDHGAAIGVDRVLCVGDICDGPGDLDRCVDLLDRPGVDVVRGNHDRWAVAGRGLEPASYTPRALAWLATLPATRSYDTPLGALLLGHGLGADDMARLQPDDTGYALASNTALHALIADGRHRIVVGGHTHRAMVRAFGDVVVINAGTLLRTHAPCCLVLDLERAEVETFDVGPEAVTRVSTCPLARTPA